MNQPDNDMVTKCMSSINEFVEAIRPTRYATDEVHGGEFLPAEIELNANWPEFERLTESEWAELRKQIMRPHGLYLWHYSVRMATLAVRRDDDRLIGFALNALIIDETYTEMRDFVSAFALILDAAKRVDADVEPVFQKAANLASPPRRETIELNLEKQLSQTSLERALEGMGYEAVGSKETFRYRTKF